MSGVGRPAQVLLDPVTLPCCGNSFDKACVDKHLLVNPHAASCPTCRKALSAAVPPVGASGGSDGTLRLVRLVWL